MVVKASEAIPLVPLVRINVMMVFEDIPEDMLPELRRKFRDAFGAYRVTTLDMHVINQPPSTQGKYPL